MIETWYCILCFMLLTFVILDGFDIGAGMLQYVVGRTEAERRMVIAAIGPLWTWHEVWLLGFGGTLLMAFPSVMAVTFAGFYLALMLLLWGLLLRGISLEVSGHVDDPLWRTAWHTCFVGSNVLLAILLGAALGNVVRGVPLDAGGKFALAFFTDFSPRGQVGILDWYTVSAAVFILAAFAAHGAVGLAHRTTGVVRERSLKAALRLWIIVVVLLVVMTVETWIIRPGFFPAMVRQPFGWVGLLCALGGTVGLFAGLARGRESLAFGSSSVLIAGLIIAGAAATFPQMLHSTLGEEYSVSAYQAAAAGEGLAIALVWWPVALVLSIVYFMFVYRHYKGKVGAVEDMQRPY